MTMNCEVCDEATYWTEYVTNDHKKRIRTLTCPRCRRLFINIYLWKRSQWAIRSAFNRVLGA